MEEWSRYSMLIEWSNEDRAYLVTLPEWAHRILMPVTHGDTYDEAAGKGQEALRMLVRSAREEGEQAPSPRTFDQSYAASDTPAPAPALP